MQCNVRINLCLVFTMHVIFIFFGRSTRRRFCQFVCVCVCVCVFPMLDVGFGGLEPGSISEMSLALVLLQLHVLVFWGRKAVEIGRLLLVTRSVCVFLLLKF